MVGPLLKTLLFTIVVPGSVAVYVPLFLIERRHALWKSPLATVGWILIALGAIVYLICAFDFSSGGRGTPAPIDPPKRLVSGKLYRITRNPMYVGVLSIVAGEAILFRSSSLAIYCAVLALAFHTFVVLYEEPALRKQFGDSYLDYCRQVPRWLIPSRRV